MATTSPPADELHIVGRVKKVGNSLAFFIPASEARAAGIQDGDAVDVRIRREVPHPLGLLEELPYEPFDRRQEGLWRDRV